MKINSNEIVTSRQQERGVASILTVVFFILIASVIMIGFMRLSLNEGRQALEDSMSKSALAAAYSGINDAKRAMLYCLQHKNNLVMHPECDESQADSITNPNCPGFFANDTLTGILGMPDPDDSPDYSIPVGDDPTDTINERYTCVIVSNDTVHVSGHLPDDNTTLVPLRGVAAFSSVRISWHRKPVLNPPDLTGMDYRGSGNELRASYRHPSAYGNYFFEWGTDWPALLRASVFSHPQAGITYDANGLTNIAEATSHLYPRHSLSATSTSAAIGGSIPRQLVNCNSSGYQANGLSYLCQMTFTDFGASPAFNPASPANNTLYLQLTGMYVDTDFTVELLDNLGTPVKFENVSPEVDSTGAVGDTYRRVKVQLRYQGSTPILPNAIDTGAGICKNFIVGNNVSIFRETCGY